MQHINIFCSNYCSTCNYYYYYYYYYYHLRQLHRTICIISTPVKN